MPSVWLADAPPASAGALDDEFADASAGVPSGWTEVDHSTVQTVSEDEEGLVLTHATNNPGSMAGIYKADPTGNITIWTKVSLSGLGVTVAHQGGIALWEDATNAAGDLAFIVLHVTSTDVQILVQTWSDHDSFGSTLASRSISVDVAPSHVYLRIRRTTTTYNFDFSTDGLGWQQIHTGTLGFTPGHMGPVACNLNSGVTIDATFAFFRSVASDVGITGLVGGDRITVTAA